MAIEKEAPRVNSFKPERVSKPFGKRHKSIKYVRLEVINVDAECKKDIDSGNGFFITNEEDFNEKTGTRTIDGLFSPLYGADTFSDSSSDDMFKCECGKMTGGIYEGETCPECGTKVVFTDSKLSIMGYISLGNYCIINPTVYGWLEHAIGGKELQSIIKFNNKFNVNGKNVSTRTKNSPYNGIGLIAFRDNFDEIIDYYLQKNKRQDYYDLIQEYRDCIFTHYVSVYSALLRPLVKDESKISVFNVNRSYSVILANAKNIQSIDTQSGVDKTMIIENSLHEIQTEFNTICTNDIVKTVLSSKKGIIRGSLTACRVDYSGRFIIAAGVGLRTTQVNVPYIAGCELMRPLIIKALNSIENINIREANSAVDNALRRFDKKIWLIMNYIIRNSKNPPMMMVQRSPSLLQESMRLMEINMIKFDINDLTLDVPTAILSGMNADYDGDTFACNMIYDNRLKEAWKVVHSPDCHFISRHDGKYSGHAEFIKDTAVTLSELWEMGKTPDYYACWASDSERNEIIAKTAEC